MNCTLIAHIAQRQQTANPIGSTFAFFANTQAKQKNAKELPSQRTKTLQTMDNRATKDRTPACNSGFAKKRVQWLIEHSTSHQHLWFIDNLVLRNPLLRKAAKRWLQPLRNI